MRLTSSSSFFSCHKENCVSNKLRIILFIRYERTARTVFAAAASSRCVDVLNWLMAAFGYNHGWGLLAGTGSCCTRIVVVNWPSFCLGWVFLTLRLIAQLQRTPNDGWMTGGWEGFLLFGAELGNWNSIEPRDLRHFFAPFCAKWWSIHLEVGGINMILFREL